MFVALASVALISCGGEEEKKDDEKKAGWSDEQVDQFMETCVKRASENADINAEEYCGCMMDKVKEKYPNPKDAGQMDMEWMQKEAAKCLGM